MYPTKQILILNRGKIFYKFLFDFFRRKKYSEMVVKKGSEEAADQATNDWERWPPPKMDARTLFNLFYAEKIENAFKKREKENRLEKENKKKIL